MVLEQSGFNVMDTVKAKLPHQFKENPDIDPFRVGDRSQKQGSRRSTKNPL